MNRRHQDFQFSFRPGTIGHYWFESARIPEFLSLIFKRPIKQILLLHIGAFDALMLDELLSAYKKAGVKFIGLNAAVRDVAYALNPGIVWEGELTFLEQMAQSKHMVLPAKPEVPLKVLDSLCR